MTNSDMIEVTRDEFLAFVGPRDIVLNTLPDVTLWELRDRTVVGKSTPGWRCTGPKVYMLAKHRR